MNPLGTYYYIKLIAVIIAAQMVGAIFGIIIGAYLF